MLRVSSAKLVGTTAVVVQLILLVVKASLVALAAAPGRLASNLRGSLNFLGGVRIPIRTVTVVVSVTLHFVPVLVRRASGVVGTRVTEKTSFRRKGVVGETGDVIPLLMPLFMSTFEHTSSLTVTVRTEYCGNKRNEAGVGPLMCRGSSGVTCLFVFTFLTIIVILEVLLPIGLNGLVFE